MLIANVNGVNLNYEIAGQGEAVVLLHGFPGSTRYWVHQIPVLSLKYKVIAWDQRGLGKSAAPSREQEYSIEIFADDVFGLLRVLNIKKCCLVGHSFGGFVALEFALKHQNMLTALALADTSGGEWVRDPGYAEMRQSFDRLTRSQGMETAFEWEPVIPRLAEIKVPTLILWGDQDSGFAEGVQTLKERIANSELVTVKGAGHFSHREAPDVFNEALLKFLDRVKW